MPLRITFSIDKPVNWKVHIARSQVPGKFLLQSFCNLIDRHVDGKTTKDEEKVLTSINADALRLRNEYHEGLTRS